MNRVLERIATVLIALAVLAFLGYQGYTKLFPSVQTETVYAHSVYKTVDAEGLVIRNETPVTGKISEGYVYYSVSNGERVAKGGKIAEVYRSEEDALAAQQLLQLDKSIADLEIINTQGVANRVNMDMINRQLASTIQELAGVMHSPRMEGLNDIHADLLELLNKQQLTTGKVTDFSEQIAALKEERKALASSHKGAQSAVSSPVAGYFVSQVDGYETALSYEEVDKLTVENIQQSLKNKPTINADHYVGKVVGDYEWYLACVVSEKNAVRMQIGTHLTVLLPFATDETIPVEVVASNPDKKGSVAIIFKSTQMSEALSSVRGESVQIQIEHYQGLRVPKNALVFDENNQTGVYIRVGNTAVFRKVNILYSAADYSLCEADGEAGGLKLYDDLIVEGKGLYDGKIIQ